MNKKIKKKHVSVIFPKEIRVGKRIWGEERLLALIPKILSLKKLKIKKGKKGGLQYHRKKNECGSLYALHVSGGDAGKIRKASRKPHRHQPQGIRTPPSRLCLGGFDWALPKTFYRSRCSFSRVDAYRRKDPQPPRRRGQRWASLKTPIPGSAWCVFLFPR